MRKVYVVSYKLFDFQKDAFLIGGIQTYIRDLCLACKEAGCKVALVQVSTNENNMTDYKGVTIINRKAPDNSMHKSYQRIFDYLFVENDSSDTRFVISTDQMGVKSNSEHVFTIQHGIAFDIPGYMIPGFWSKNAFLQRINKLLRCMKNVQRFYQTPNVVCVDYNYYNWFRTLGTIPDESKVKVIPNYTSSMINKGELDYKLSQNSRRRIVFARRFVDYRGTLMFAKVAKRLIEDGKDVDITFAGSGPLLERTRRLFDNIENVHFTSFSAEESILFHKKYDIAVVPTIFSEGTSLSLIEAMAAGCYPIATHVGGMTNIVLDGYNGSLVAPNEKELYNSIDKVMSLSSDSYNQIVRCAYETATRAFSYDKWKDNWVRILFS